MKRLSAQCGLVLALHFCACAATFAVVHPVERGGVEGTVAGLGKKTNPPLRPTSDKAFYNKDYPFDKSPAPPHHLKFGYPYPIIQDNGAYDRDFVKDENADGGEWKAQSAYDRSRNLLPRQKVEVEVAAAGAQRNKDALAAVRAEEAEAEQNAKKAERRAEGAKRHLDHVSSDLNRLAGDKSSGKPSGGEIGKAVDEVSREIKKVEECQHRLRQAKARLDLLVRERETRKQSLDNARAQAAASRVGQEAQREAAKEGEYKLLDKKLLEQVQTQEHKHEQAVAEFEAKQAEVKKAEGELQQAAERLHRARQRADGGAEGVAADNHRSRGARPVANAAALALCLAAWAAGV